MTRDEAMVVFADPAATTDDKVLARLQTVSGSTAWMMRNTVGEERAAISAALQRLKRKGQVINEGGYWMVAPVIGAAP
jgi:hypothetical protein